MCPVKPISGAAQFAIAERRRAVGGSSSSYLVLAITPSVVVNWFLVVLVAFVPWTK